MTIGDQNGSTQRHPTRWVNHFKYCFGLMAICVVLFSAVRALGLEMPDRVGAFIATLGYIIPFCYMMGVAVLFAVRSPINKVLFVLWLGISGLMIAMGLLFSFGVLRGNLD